MRIAVSPNILSAAAQASSVNAIPIADEAVTKRGLVEKILVAVPWSGFAMFEFNGRTKQGGIQYHRMQSSHLGIHLSGSCVGRQLP